MRTKTQRKPSDLFSNMQNKGNWKQSHNKLPRKGEKQPNGKQLPINAEPAVVNDRRRNEMGSSRLPPISTTGLCKSRQAKVSFMPAKTMMKPRRLSLPLEPSSLPPKSILQKRNSVPIVSNNTTNHSKHVNFCTPGNLPWERELNFPPVTNNGMLLCSDEDGFLPPMPIRLARPDAYTYSEEFKQALLEVLDVRMP